MARDKIATPPPPFSTPPPAACPESSIPSPHRARREERDANSTPLPHPAPGAKSKNEVEELGRWAQKRLLEEYGAAKASTMLEAVKAVSDELLA